MNQHSVYERNAKSKEEIEAVVHDLKQNGYWFWQSEIYDPSRVSEIVKSLKKTRSSFISILEESTRDTIIHNLVHPKPPLTPALAVKHAMIATDASAELLDRAKDYIAFHNIKEIHIGRTDSSIVKYTLQELGTHFTSRLNNHAILKASLPLLEDICHIIAFGSEIVEFKNFPSLRKLRLGTICGDKEAIRNYFAEIYLDVSRQVKGIVSQSSGNLPQWIVRSKLEKYFHSDPRVSFVAGNRVPGVGSEEGQKFDIVLVVNAEDGPVYVAIEVAFQETTNSVIERKARQARDLYVIFRRLGYYLCFAVDGAGYFAREKALKEIVANSDLCVTFKDSELEKLCVFISNLQRSQA